MGKWLSLAFALLCGVGLAWAGEEGPPQGPPIGPPIGPPQGRPGGQPGQRPEPGRPPQGMPPEMMRQFAEFGGLPGPLVQFWREADPEYLADLREQSSTRPEETREVFMRAMGELRELQELKARDPEAFDLMVQRRKLERQVRRLAQRIRTAKADEKEPAQAELRATLERLYDITTSLREREVATTEQRLKELRDQAKKWRDHKADIIDRRAKELTGELDYLKW